MPYFRFDPETHAHLKDATKRLALIVREACTPAGMTLTDVRTAMADQEGYCLTADDTTTRLTQLAAAGLIRQDGHRYWWTEPDN